MQIIASTPYTTPKNWQESNLYIIGVYHHLRALFLSDSECTMGHWICPQHHLVWKQSCDVTRFIRFILFYVIEFISPTTLTPSACHWKRAVIWKKTEGSQLLWSILAHKEAPGWNISAKMKHERLQNCRIKHISTKWRRIHKTSSLLTRDICRTSCVPFWL